MRAQLDQQWPLTGHLGDKFRRDPVRRWKAGPDGSCVITGSLNLRSYAGVLSFGIDGTPFTVEAEVACRKLNYFREFKTLLTQVAEELTELLLQHEAPTSIEFSLNDRPSVLETAAIVVLRQIMQKGNLPYAIDRILARPHSRLKTTSETSEAPAAESISVDTIPEAIGDLHFRRGRSVNGPFRGLVPQALPAEEFEENFDTPENRYVLSFLQAVANLSRRLASHLASSGRTAARECVTWGGQIEEFLDAPLWRQVGVLTSASQSSPVLQRRDGYRDILRFDLQLRLGLSLNWDQARMLADGLRGDIRPVSELYEYWCYLTLRRVIYDLCGGEEIGPGVLHLSSNGFDVNLRRGKQSRIKFKFSRAGSPPLNIFLFYNRRFVRPKNSASGWNGSYTTPFHPDFSVLVRRDGDTASHWLHFDAKYRTDANIFFHPQSVEEVLEDGETDEMGYVGELQRAHRRDDLFKMHTYRDGILGSRGSYILFPGDAVAKEQINVRHPSFFDGEAHVQVPSVGAFALTPGASQSQEEVLKCFLRGVLHLLSESAGYAEEYGFSPAP
jgi:predicted component of viral defense system (DUF524 family)